MARVGRAFCGRPKALPLSHLRVRLMASPSKRARSLRVTSPEERLLTYADIGSCCLSAATLRSVAARLEARATAVEAASAALGESDLLAVIVVYLRWREAREVCKAWQLARDQATVRVRLFFKLADPREGEGADDVYERHAQNRSALLNAQVTWVSRTFPNLESMNQSFDSPVPTDALRALARGCPKLSSVNLAGTHVSDESVMTIAREATQLTKVELAFTGMSDDGLVAMAASRDLVSIRLYCNKKISETGAIAATQHCPNLKLFQFTGPRSVNAVGPALVLALSNNCPKLEKLSLDSGSSITSAAAETLFRSCPRLTDIRTSRSDRISRTDILERPPSGQPQMQHNSFWVGGGGYDAPPAANLASAMGGGMDQAGGFTSVQSAVGRGSGGLVECAPLTTSPPTR